MTIHATGAPRPSAGSAPAALGPLGRFRVAFYYIYIACTLGMNAVVLIPRSSSGELGDNSLFMASWLILLGLTFITYLTLRKQNATNLVITFSIAGLAIASAVWSISPGSSLIYGTLFAGNILVAHMITTDLSLFHILKIISRVTVVLVILGLIGYSVGYDQVYYYDSHDRPNILGLAPLRGFFPHKIVGSLYAVVGAMATLATTRGARRNLALLVIALFVALTGSSTGIILYLVALGAYALAAIAHRGRVRGGTFLLLGATSSAVALWAVYANWSTILAALGRDDTLTGRTILWEWGIRTWGERPLLGWGFSGFFRSEESEILNVAVPAFRNYDVPHFHQSFIQTAVDLGIVGLTTLVLVLSHTLVRSYLRLSKTGEKEAIAVWAITTTYIIAAFAMFIFLTYNHFATFSLFLFFFSLRSAATHRKLSDEIVASHREVGG